MRLLIMSCLIRIYTVCKKYLFWSARLKGLITEWCCLYDMQWEGKRTLSFMLYVHSKSPDQSAYIQYDQSVLCLLIYPRVFIDSVITVFPARGLNLFCWTKSYTPSHYYKSQLVLPCLYCKTVQDVQVYRIPITTTCVCVCQNINLKSSSCFRET